jgi:hypothetical protein
MAPVLVYSASQAIEQCLCSAPKCGLGQCRQESLQQTHPCKEHFDQNYTTKAERIAFSNKRSHPAPLVSLISDSSIGCTGNVLTWSPPTETIVGSVPCVVIATRRRDAFFFGNWAIARVISDMSVVLRPNACAYESASVSLPTT